MKKYDHKAIERKWQKYWKTSKIYTTPDKAPGPASAPPSLKATDGHSKATAGKKENFYLLVEFPYPSGNLHAGHWYAFAVPDILARALRMQGKNVMYPIGFDAFGLPAENAAIKNKLNPRTWTEGNIAYMKKQIASMGTSFDWSREVITCNPDYYKWTQWLFLQLFKKGLAYQKETAVNWCPKDKTVLANEQVTDGKCERCDSEVVQKKMLQWNIKITDYADRLIDDLSGLDWPEQIKESQRNWIGRSNGAEISFPIEFENKNAPQPNFLLLHGYKGSPTGAFFSWLKRELESKGYAVQAPELPNTSEPKEYEQVKYVFDHCHIDENTVIIGHSLGAVVAMKLLQKINRPVGGLVLVAPAIDSAFANAEPRTYWKDFSWDIKYDKLKTLAGLRLVLSDAAEKGKRGAYIAHLADILDAQIAEGKANEEHFLGAQEPLVLAQLMPRITVFTTRPDTLFGATYVVLAPEHPWVKRALAHQRLLRNEKEIGRYIALTEKKSDMDRQTNKEKTGVRLEGVDAINPATRERIPVYIADYVLGHYGTGAIMAVPAHDERDFEFASRYGLPIREVISAQINADRLQVPIQTLSAQTRNNADKNGGELPYMGEGLMIDSGRFSGLTSQKGREAITEELGVKKTTYKLRDWIVSRQRYWGVPIPIIHCGKCGSQPVGDVDLPVELPEVKDYLPEGSGKSPLAKAKKWVAAKCPKCAGEAERETDTLDTFVDSSWYFLRYTDPNNKKEFASKEKQANWMPVNLYSGGAEHTTMHLLYSRFWHKALFDLGLVGESEPYKRRMNRSLILGPDGQKMSKSRGNVIDPDLVVERLGADTVRMYLAFIGPYNEVSSYPWNPDGVVGIRRFLERVWRMGQSTVDSPQLTVNANIEPVLHRTVKKIGEDIALLKFNTAISSLMILLNAIEKEGAIGQEQFGVFLKLLSPFAPHITEELWHEAGNKSSIHLEKWPVFDPALLRDENVTIAIQINGRTRGEVQVPTDSDKKTVEDAALAAVGSRVEGKKILRTIYVPSRLVNFVLEGE
ncbi:MAG: leucine--tRNA ligase [bacterium]|nr:leucine--tRNA ligase [bacterium]